jgi:hypothetical protein
MKRRDLLKSAALLLLLPVPGLHAFADSSKQFNDTKHLWQGYNFGSYFPVKERNAPKFRKAV